MKHGWFILLCLFCFKQQIAGSRMHLSDTTISESLFISDIDTVVITNCTFSNISDYAIRLERAQLAQISNCLFQDIRLTTITSGVICGRNLGQIDINNCRFYEIVGECIRFPFSGTSRLEDRVQSIRIESCLFEGMYDGPNQFGKGITLFHTDSVFIEGNTIARGQDIGIHIGTLGSPQNTQNQRIEYCVILGNRIDSMLGDGILANENIRYALIQENHISNIAYDGIGARPQEGDHGIYWQSPGGIMLYNTIHDIQDGRVAGRPGDGISMRTDGHILGNTIWNCTHRGIGYFGDHDAFGSLLIANNTIFDTDFNSIYCNAGDLPLRHSIPDSVFIYHNTLLAEQIQSNINFNSPIAFRNMSSWNEVIGNIGIYWDQEDTTRYLFIANSNLRVEAFNLFSNEDIGFVEINTRNLDLIASSKAIDFVPAGRTPIHTDKYGKNRTPPYDAGAHEFFTTSAHDIQQNVRLLVYPNPATDALHIESATSIKRIRWFSVSDGRLLWSQGLKVPQRIFEPEIPKYHGLCVLVLEDESGHSFTKEIYLY